MTTHPDSVSAGDVRPATGDARVRAVVAGEVVEARLLDLVHIWAHRVFGDVPAPHLEPVAADPAPVQVSRRPLLPTVTAPFTAPFPSLFPLLSLRRPSAPAPVEAEAVRVEETPVVVWSGFTIAVRREPDGFVATFLRACTGCGTHTAALPNKIRTGNDLLDLIGTTYEDDTLPVSTCTHCPTQHDQPAQLHGGGVAGEVR